MSNTTAPASATVDLGSIIWTSFKPMLKLYTVIALGYYVGKKNILDVSTSRNVSYINQHVLLPSLIFSSVVTNLQYTDIKTIAIICLNSFLYMGIAGILLMLISLSFLGNQSTKFHVAKFINCSWRYGAIFSLVFSTGSNLLIAYLQSIEYNTKLFSTAEINRGVAFVFIAFVCFDFVIYNLGGYHLIKLDFNSLETTKSNESTSPEASDSKDDSQPVNNEESSDDISSISSSINSSVMETEPRPFETTGNNLQKHHSQHSNNSLQRTASQRSRLRAIELRKLPSQNIQDVVNEFSKNRLNNHSATDLLNSTNEQNEVKHEIPIKQKSNISHFFLNVFLKSFLQPSLLATLISFIVAMIPWLKNLFSATPSYAPSSTIQTHIKDAPDEYPPLNIFMNYCTYLGGAQVPISLFLLGATFSRLDFINYDNSNPGKKDEKVLFKDMFRSFKYIYLRKNLDKSLNLVFFVTLSIIKLCVLPVIGIAWISSIKDSQAWFGTENQKIVIFVLCLVWALPTYTAQVYLTAIYTSPPTENTHKTFDNNSARLSQLHCVSCCLFIQFTMLMVSLPFVSSYILKHVLQY